MAIPGKVVLAERLAARSKMVAENEKDTTISDRRDRKVVHRFVPHGELGARGVSTGGPPMTLALDKHGRFLASEVKVVRLLELTDPDGHSEPRSDADPGVGEALDRGTLEVDADLSVRTRADPLE